MCNVKTLQLKPQCSGLLKCVLLDVTIKTQMLTVMAPISGDRLPYTHEGVRARIDQSVQVRCSS